MYAADAEISGILKAGPGSSLGGWTVSSQNGYVFGNISEVSSDFDKEYYGIGFDTNSVGKENIAFAIGSLAGIEETSSWGNAVFYVTGKGKLVSKDAEINGGVFDNCIINETCTIEGKLTANAIDVSYEGQSIYTSNGRLFSTYTNSSANLQSELHILGDDIEFSLRNTSDNSITARGRIYTYDTTFCISAAKGEGRLYGTWTSENDLSDMRIKNSIDDYIQEYDTFFDNLRPRRYKYNNGTSNRYHTGYVAQEVVEAIESAGLTTQDFAGVMLTNPNTENECWYLRRDEFVALNTWQIQKLKAHVLELENRINKLTF